MEFPIQSELLFSHHSHIMPYDPHGLTFVADTCYATDSSISTSAGIHSSELESKDLFEVKPSEILVQPDAVQTIGVESLKTDIDSLRVEMRSNFASIESSLKKMMANGLQSSGKACILEDSKSTTDATMNRKRLKEQLNTAINQKKSTEIAPVDWKEALFGISAQNHRLGKEGSRSHPTASRPLPSPDQIPAPQDDTPDIALHVRSMPNLRARRPPSPDI
jgi:hypothetical protein